MWLRIHVAGAKLSALQGQTATQILHFILYFLYPSLLLSPLSISFSLLYTISPWLGLLCFLFFISYFYLCISFTCTFSVSASPLAYTLCWKRGLRWAEKKERKGEKKKRGSRGRHLQFFRLLFCGLSKKYCVCVCVCVSARVCVRVCVCV